MVMRNLTDISHRKYILVCFVSAFKLYHLRHFKVFYSSLQVVFWLKHITNLQGRDEHRLKETPLRLETNMSSVLAKHYVYAMSDKNNIEIKSKP